MSLELKDNHEEEPRVDQECCNKQPKASNLMDSPTENTNLTGAIPLGYGAERE